MRRRGRRAAAVAAAALVVAVPAAGQVSRAGQGSPAGDPLPVLAVPFVPQSEALCGGAAVSMVLRYRGERGVRAERFAHLLTADGRGIPTGRLATEAGRRGFEPLVFRGDRPELRRQIEAGRPVIALLEVAPDRYHYVVVVASWPGGTAFHDPARAPWRVLPAAEFDRAWEGAGRWAMVLGPASGSPGEAGGSPAEVAGADTPAEACAPALRAAVRLARTGRAGEAEALLDAALEACPGRSEPLRELAGLRLRQGRWEEAARLSRQALERRPGDDHALRTLATARYLAGDEEAALAAWSEAGASTVDLVRVSGLGRTRHGAVARLLGIEPDEPLTPGRLRTAGRRLDDLPAAAATRLDYRPVGDGAVELRAAVLERPLAPSSPPELAALGLRALATGELSATVAGPTGAGEAWRLAWRPSSARPRLELSGAVPARLGFPALWRLSGGWERERWLVDPAGAGAGDPARAEGTRRRLAVGAESWATGWLRWRGGAGLERWSEAGIQLGLAGGVEARASGERLSARLDLAAWRGLEQGSLHGRVDADLGWRTRSEVRGTVLQLRAGASLVSSDAPRFLWPGAGTGRARAALLRAHPFLEAGAVAGPAFGPRLAHGGLEVVRWLDPAGLLPGVPVRLGLAAFGDAARAWGAGGPSPALVDAGLGLRLGLAGAGRLRLDVARGLTDRASAVSIGWHGGGSVR